MKRAIGHLSIGIISGLGLAGAAFALWALIWAATVPVPYRDVHIIEQWRDGDWLHVTATFIKTDCVFQKLEARGVTLSGTVPLEWRDREAPQGDRLVGLQTLRIDISTVYDLDAVQIWTRHDCAGVPVDRLFATIDPNETIIPPETRAGHGGHLEPAHVRPFASVD